MSIASLTFVCLHIAVVSNTVAFCSSCDAACHRHCEGGLSPQIGGGSGTGVNPIADMAKEPVAASWLCRSCTQQQDSAAAAVPTGPSVIEAPISEPALPARRMGETTTASAERVASTELAMDAEANRRMGTTLNEMYRRCLLQLVQPGWSIDIASISDAELERFPLNTFLEYTKSAVQQVMHACPVVVIY